MGKGTAGWVGAILHAGGFIPGFQWLHLAALPFDLIENQYQTKKFKAQFGKSGESQFAGSPSYSWESPQTVSNPSIPVPLIFGTAATGGNIINAWTETINVYQTKWDIITPLNQTMSGYINTFTTDTASRGVKIDIPMLASPGRYFKLYFRYRKTGDIEWLNGGTTTKVWGGYTSDDMGNVEGLVKTGGTYTIINPENYLNEFQWDIEIRLSDRETTQEGLSGQQYWGTIYSAHENLSDTNNIAGSKDYQYLVLGLARGEISGIGNIKLNNNPIGNYSSDYALKEYRHGTNEQPPISWVDKVVTETPVNAKLLYNAANPAGGQVTQNGNVVDVVIVLSFPSGLYQIDSKGKYQSWEATFKIEYRLNGGSTWTAFPDKKIAGKNINPFKNAVKYSLPQGKYDIRVTKTSQDPNPTGTPATIGDVYWAVMQEYVSEPLSYPNTAIAAYRLLASDAMSGNVPQFYFEIDGAIIDVPNLTVSGSTVEYDSTYWDGTYYRLVSDNTICTDTNSFVKQHTRNPIWIVRHLCLSADGLGDYISSMTDSDLRILAKYCDEYVPINDGSGKSERRFELDGILDSQGDARNWLETILQHFRGFYAWSDGKLKLGIYKPENPVHIFTMGNIIADSLSISYTSAQDKFNAVKIQHADKANEYKLTDIYVYDSTQSTKPTKVHDIALPMITRRSQAVRMGRGILNKNKYITEVVQFNAAIDAIPCEAGNIVDFAHDVLGYGLASGRIMAATINSVTIDTQVTIGAGTYKIKVKLSDDTIEERTISNGAGTYYTVSTTTNFTSIPPVDSLYSVGESTKVTKSYRIISITKSNNQERRITAVEENPSIYSDTGDNIVSVGYSSLKNPLAMPKSVTNLTVKEVIYDPGDGSKINTIVASWRPPSLVSDPTIKPSVNPTSTGGSIPAGTYYVKYTLVGGGGETMPSPSQTVVTTGSTSRITVTVRTFSQKATSAKVYIGSTLGQETYQGDITTSNGSITITSLSTGTMSIPVLSTVNEDTSYDYGKVYLSENDGLSWELVGEGKTTYTIHNVNKNINYKIAVASVSQYGITQSITTATKVILYTGGDITPPADTTFIDANYATTTSSTYLTNSPEASQNTTSDDWNYIYDIKLRWNAVTDADLAGYEIRTENANWGVSNGNLIYRGLNTYFLFANPTNSTYTFYVKAFDFSGNYAVNAGSIVINNSAPVLSDIYLDFTGKDCKLWWQDVQDEDFVGYQVHVYSDSSRTNLVRVDTPTNPHYRYTYEMNIQDNGYPGIRDIYFTVKALDSAGQQATKDVAAHNDAPDAPTGLTALGLYGGVYLNWDEVTDPDVKGYNVYVWGVLTAYVTGTNYRHNGTEWTTYSYYVKAVDTFGEGGQSSTVTGMAEGAVVDITPPAAPVNLSATTTNTSMADGTQVSSITATWSENLEGDLAGYILRIKQSGGNYVEFGATSNIYTWTSGIKAGITYYINVQAIDESGNKSGWSNNGTDYSIVAASDGAPPAACSNLQAFGGFGYVALTWTNPTDKDLAYVEIHRANRNNRYYADKITRAYSNWYHDDASEYLNNPTSAQLSQSGIVPFDAALVCDGDISNNNNAWHTDAATSGAYIKVDLGVGGDRAYVRAKMYAGGINYGKYAVEYSDDDISYIAVTTTGNGLNVEGGAGWKEVSWNNAGRHRYWRFKLENTPGVGSWMRELELYDTARYYWIVPVDTSGNMSTFFPYNYDAGVTASTVLLTADNIITAGAVITRSAMIKDAIISNAHIIELYADKISSGDIATARMSVNAGNAVNGGTTLIQPGKVSVNGSGALLSSWSKGGDDTHIDGGAISANTITANKISIGSRNISITGLIFKANDPSTNYISWTAGSIHYVNDSGTAVVATIAGNNASYISGTLYIYWVKDSTALSTTTTSTTAYNANNIVLATYQGGTAVIPTYGSTIIDGDFIRTGTIQSSHLFATNLGAIFANLGTVTAGLIDSTAQNYNFWDLNTTTGTAFSLGGSAQTFKVQADGSGALGNNKITWDVNGNITIDGTAIIGSSPASKLGMFYDFEETWQSSTNLSRWTNYNGSGELSIQTSGGWNGSNYLQVGLNDGSDMAWLIHDDAIPFDPSKLYKITVIAETTAGIGTFFAGFAGVGADGATFVNADGLSNYSSQHYCISDILLTNTWAIYTGYLKGYGATNGYEGNGSITSPRKMHPNVRYFKPLMIANYNNATGITAISSITIKDATSELLWSGVTGTGKPADNATVGATWGVDLSGRPIELTDGRVATALNPAGTVVTKVVPTSVAGAGSAGLYLGSDYLGYYNGSAWKTYMQNNGNFYLSGTGVHGITWDGSTLNIRGSLTADDIVSGGTITGNTFQTNSVNPKAVISSVTKDLRFYNSSGAQVATITGDDDWGGTLKVSHTNNYVYSLNIPAAIIESNGVISSLGVSESAYRTAGDFNAGLSIGAAYSTTGQVSAVIGVATADYVKSFGGVFIGQYADMRLGGTKLSPTSGTSYKGDKIKDASSTYRPIGYGVFGTGDKNSTTNSAPKRGTGFTVTRNGVGDYSITFTTPFANVPVVIAGAESDVGVYAVTAGNVTTTGFKVYYSGPVDRDFNFFALAV